MNAEATKGGGCGEWKAAGAVDDGQRVSTFYAKDRRADGG